MSHVGSCIAIRHVVIKREEIITSPRDRLEPQLLITFGHSRGSLPGNCRLFRV
jgi:hypothetical protein